MCYVNANSCSVIQVYVVKLESISYVVVQRVMAGKAFLLCVLILASAQGVAFEGSIDEEIIVTGVAPALLIDIPRSITVITAEDIANSGATIPELLARQANITLTSFTGNAKFTSIDIRGSGDTSVSNVLTLLDGIKMNTPDLAGTDFSIIPMIKLNALK